MPVLADGQFVPRRIVPEAQETLAGIPVLMLEGPRSVGKSTLLRQLGGDLDAAILDFDESAVLRNFLADPQGALPPEGTVCVDEYQKAPIVLDLIKARLNHETRNAWFLLAGSTRRSALPRGTQSLTGRIIRLPVFPLAQREIEQTDGDLLTMLFDEPDLVRGLRSRPTLRSGYVDRVMGGGFPLALKRDDRGRGRWFDGYFAQVVDSDVSDIANVRHTDQLARVARALAARTGQVVNVATLGSELELARTTTERYMELLGDVYFVQRLPSWGRTLRSRTVKAPKVHMVDSGLAAHLLGLTKANLAFHDPAKAAQFGHLLETFVVNEFLRHASWTYEVRIAGHWRTHDGHEVDLVLERRDGTVIAIEVKSSEMTTARDLRGLRALRDALGSRFRAGYVMHLGRAGVRLEDRIFSMPVEVLWTPVPSGPARVSSIVEGE